MLSEGKGWLDEETLGLILKSKETNDIKEFLSSHLMREAKFDTDTLDKVITIQIRGEIKHRFLTTKHLMVNAPMIEKTIDPEGTGLIEVKTLPVKVDMLFGPNNKALNHHLDANSNNLQNEQARQIIEASWALNIRTIQIYCVINVAPFLCYAATSVFYPDDWLLWYLTPALNTLMLLIELNEMRLIRMRYLKDPWNYLELTGNVLSIYFVLARHFSEDR